MAKEAATHSGHCQACGRLQKLPESLLSKHGYTVAHGYFSGTCSGAAHPPFEVSCDLVKVFIEDAKGALARLEMEMEDLRKPATEPVAWIRPYLSPNFSGFKGGYVWMRVELRPVVAYQHTDDYVDFEYTVERVHPSLPEGKVDRLKEQERRERGAGLLAKATEKNSERAAWLEKFEATSLRRYIKWQEERVRTWKPEPLLPVSHRDKQGFEPTKEYR